VRAFSFKLEKFLDIKKFYEDEAKIELGKAVGILSELESRIRLVAEERIRIAEAQFGSGNTTADYRQYMHYILRLDNTKEQLLIEAAQAELKVEKARAVFIEASRERKVLDELKAKQYKSYRKEMFAEEVKSLDDAGRASAH